VSKQSRTFFRRVRRRKFGELLLSQGVISSEQLNEALELQRRDGGLLGEIMVHKGFISENEIVRSLSTQYGMPVLRVADFDVDKDLVGAFSPRLLYVSLVLPLCSMADVLLVTVADLPDDGSVKKLEEAAEREIVYYLSSSSDILAALARFAPVSDDDLQRFTSLRRRRCGVARPSRAESSESEESADADGGDAQEQQTIFSEIDNAWESIFDEAESNIKREGL
jgi:hypothetical protein